MTQTTQNPVRLITIFLSLLLSLSAFAQDDIIMLNNDVIKAKVDEVGVNTIKYRKVDNLDGPQYDLPKANIYMIVYANGSRDVINAQSGSTQNASTGTGTDDNLPAPADGVYTNTNIETAPPAIPTYVQPACPEDGYLWTPGYWAFGPLGYYWVPGVWAAPPRAGYLWTPGYWFLEGGFYRWHGGYWGEHMGYYGGVYYGFGYYGSGYYGGRWEGGYFRYNTSVSNVNVTVVHNTYIDNTVVKNTTVNRASYNGAGGVTAQPTIAERSAASEQHVAITSQQQAHITAARTDKSQYVSVNKGTPAVAAINKPGGQAFSPQGQTTAAHPNTTAAMAPMSHLNMPAQPAKQPANNMQESKQPAQAAPAQKEMNTAPAQKEANVAPAQQYKAPSPANNTTRQASMSNNTKPAMRKQPKQQNSRQAPTPHSEKR